MNIDAFMTWIAADEAGIIDGVEYLTGPAMIDLAKFWNQISRPCLQRFETDPRIIGFAGLVVGPADDDEIGFSVNRLDPHIMVGIEGVPIDCVSTGAPTLRTASSSSSMMAGPVSSAWNRKPSSRRKSHAISSSCCICSIRSTAAA